MNTPLKKIKTADELVKEYGERLIRGPQPNQEKEWENMVQELHSEFSALKDCRVEFLQKMNPYLDQNSRFQFLQILLKSEKVKIDDERTKADFLRPNNLARAAFKFYNTVQNNPQLQKRLNSLVSFDPTCLDNIMKDIPDEVLQQFAKLGFEHNKELFGYLTFNYLNTVVFTEMLSGLKDPERGLHLIAQEVVKGLATDEQIDKKLEEKVNSLKRNINDSKTLSPEQKQQEINKIDIARNKAKNLIDGMRKSDLKKQFDDETFKEKYNNLKTAPLPSRNETEINKKIEALKTKDSLWAKIKVSVTSAWKSLFTNDSKQSTKAFQTTTPTNSSESNVAASNKSETSDTKPSFWQRIKDTMNNIATSISKISAKPDLEITKVVLSKEVEQERSKMAEIKSKITQAFSSLDQLKNNRETNSQQFNDTKRELYIDSIRLNRNELLKVIVKLEKENKDEYKPLLSEARQFLDHYNNHAKLLKMDEVKLVSDVKRNLFVGNKTEFNSAPMGEQTFQRIMQSLEQDYQELNQMKSSQHTSKNSEQFKQNMKQFLTNLSSLRNHLNESDSSNPTFNQVKKVYMTRIGELAIGCNDIMTQQTSKAKNTSRFEKFKNEARETSSEVVNKVGQLSQSLDSLKKRIDDSEKVKRSQSETPLNPTMHSPEPQSIRKLSS